MSDAKQKGWLRRLAPFLLVHRRNVALSFGAALVGMLLAALAPWIQKVVVDDSILAERRPITPWLVLLVLTGVGRFGLAFVRRYAGGRVALDVQYDLRNTIFEQLQ